MRDVYFGNLTREQAEMVYGILEETYDTRDREQALLRGEQVDKYFALGAQQNELREILERAKRDRPPTYEE